MQSCAATPTSIRRVDSSEFEKNLPGLWEGNWRWSGRSGKRHINISRIDGDRVVLTGYTSGGDYWAETNEVYGRIENSMLLLTWPAATEYGCKEKLTMTRDASNKLRLDGNSECGPYPSTVSLVKKE